MVLVFNNVLYGTFPNIVFVGGDGGGLVHESYKVSPS